MSKKNTENNNNQEKNNGKNQNTENSEKKDGGGGGGGGGKNVVVLKIDLHCDGCATKVTKRIRAFEGVRDVQIDGTTNKISVTGKVDPVKLKKKLEEKLHKKVEVLSPVLKKDGKKDGGGDDGDGKSEKTNDSNKNKKSDGKKVIPVTTAVLKVPLHCEGCIQKIQRIISKTKGYQEMKIDKKKDLVTVTGAIEMKALVDSLKKQLKRKNVEIFQNKKDEKKDKENQKENNGGGGGNGSGGKGKGGKGGGEAEGGEEWKTAGNKMQIQFGYGNGYPPYGPSFYDPYNIHAPQIFSDENPNACSIM